MDTRIKILTPDAALELPPEAFTVITGTFDVLRAEHAREIAEVRNRTGNRPVLVVVLPGARDWLPQRARAELVAALRMVDYVVIAQETDANRIVETLRPLFVARLETADDGRAGQLIAHVHGRQTR